MGIEEKIFSKRVAIIFVGLLTLWRIILSSSLQLHPDEAYYWLWSRYLDIGYFDHSPLIAYFIWATTLFSQSELWVRFSGILVAIALSIITWKLSMQFFGDKKVASGSVMLLNVYPLTMSGSIIITPDIPVLLFWGWSLYIFWQIIRSQRSSLWYLLGISFGLSLLSKYTAILLAPSLFLFLLFTDERRWLKTVYPYISFFIGLLFFIPVIYWNGCHEWISFTFQFGHGLGGESYSLGKLLEYVGGQLLVAGPLIWLLGMWASVVYLFKGNKEKLFLSLTVLPAILFFGFSSLKKLAGPNWPAFSYLTFSILVTKYMFEGQRFKRVLWFIAFLVSFSMSMLATLHAKYDVLNLWSYSEEWGKADATNFFHGWRELGEYLNKNSGMKFAVTPSHQLSAAIIYYTNEKIFAYTDPAVSRPSQFNIWPIPSEINGEGGYYIYAIGDPIGPYKGYFSSFESSDSVTVFRSGIPIRTYKVISGKGSSFPKVNESKLIVEKR